MEPIFLILGGPAIGKSTTSRLLADSLPRSIHLPVDDLRHMVRRGLALPAIPWTDEIGRQITIARRAAITVAEHYAANGFAVVMDDFWDPGDAADYRDLVRRPGVHGVLLYAPREVAYQRNRARSPGPEGDYIEGAIAFSTDIVEAVMGGLPAAGWTVIDTRDQAPGETADAIRALAGLPRAS
jgi:predicted kinase